MWSGTVCDRIGCEDPIEGPKRRFCGEHRREHGLRLEGQLEAIIADHRGRASPPAVPDTAQDQR